MNKNIRGRNIKTGKKTEGKTNLKIINPMR
jgi:hypothetical protein